MSRSRVGAATAFVLLTAAVTVTGCGHDAEQADSAASGAKPSEPQPVAKIADAPAVAAAKASVVKIRGNSPNCDLGGGGFVVAPNRVMTPAQIVAGGETFTVEVDGRKFDAHVVSYNPKRDLAILDVPNLPAAPLSFAAEEAAGGSEAILLGYSDAGDFATIPAQIREVVQLNGPDNERTTTVTREVYIIDGKAKDASGGPLLDRDGKVLGVSFGQSTDDPATSFALTAKEIAPQLPEVRNTVPVPTGSEKC